MSDHARIVQVPVIGANAFRELRLIAGAACIEMTGRGSTVCDPCCTDLAKIARVYQIPVIVIGQIPRA